MEKRDFRKVRGVIRKASKVFLVWLSTDSDYDVPVSKKAALDLVAAIEQSDDCIMAIVNSLHNHVYLDRKHHESDPSDVVMIMK